MIKRIKLPESARIKHGSKPIAVQILEYFEGYSQRKPINELKKATMYRAISKASSIYGPTNYQATANSVVASKATPKIGYTKAVVSNTPDQTQKPTKIEPEGLPVNRSYLRAAFDKQADNAQGTTLQTSNARQDPNSETTQAKTYYTSLMDRKRAAKSDSSSADNKVFSQRAKDYSDTESNDYKQYTNAKKHLNSPTHHNTPNIQQPIGFTKPKIGDDLKTERPSRPIVRHTPSYTSHYASRTGDNIHAMSHSRRAERVLPYR